MNNDKLIERISIIENRLDTIENNLGIKIEEKEIEEKKEEKNIGEEIKIQENQIKKEKISNNNNFTFNQIITFLGILGIIIGVISFYFYAVAEGWIGKTAQIGIGIVFGFLLFAFAYQLRKKKEQWSNIVLGGSYFIEYLSIWVGVYVYKVLPELFALLLSVIFLTSSILLSLKFSSRMIAYFSLVGAYIIPFISGFNSDLFVMGFYVLLSTALLIISFYKNWGDLRFISFVIMALFLLSYSNKFSNTSDILIPFLFLITIFLLYNISAIIGSLREKNEISALDSVVLGLVPIVILPMLNLLLKWPINNFAIIMMLFSFIYLGEMFYFKKKNNSLASSIYTLFSAGLITLNLGLIFMFNTLNPRYFLILFIVEWFLFTYLAMQKKEDKNLYNVYSYIFFVLSCLEFFTPKYTSVLVEDTFFLVLYLFFILACLYFVIKKYEIKFYGTAFIIGTFLIIFSIYRYLEYFIVSSELRQIILSVMWLFYTLFMFHKIKKKEVRNLIGILLAIALIKIAIVDLFILEGAYRILGFIAFGILLLIGGYYIKNDSKK